VNANRKPSEAAVAAIRRALLDEAQDTRDSSGPAREPVPGTNGLLYRGVATSFFAPRGEGKSLAVIVTTLSAAAAGERVAYFDRENGAALTREWVEAILEAHPDWGDPLAEGRWAMGRAALPDPRQGLGAGGLRRSVGGLHDRRL
jgi:hypothetical protein